MFRAVSLLGRLGRTLQVIADVKKPLTERPEFSRQYSSSLLTRKIGLQKPTTKRTFFLSKNNRNEQLHLTRDYTTEKTTSTRSVTSLHQILTEALEGIEPDPNYTVVPEFHSLYDADSQTDNIFNLAHQFVECVGTRDILRARVAIVMGVNGAGKTRFSMELPKLLLQACDHPDEIRYHGGYRLQGRPIVPLSALQASPSSHISPQQGDKCSYSARFKEQLQFLRSALSGNCKQIYIEWQHGGQAYSESIEQNWSSGVRLGLRVAAQYWFPNINFAEVRERMKDSPHLNKFDLEKVLDAMYDEDKTITALHIVLDEFQATTQFEVAAERYNFGRPKDYLSQGLARVLSTVARNNRRFFVFGTIAGTSVEGYKIVDGPGDDVFSRSQAQRLSQLNIQNAIRNTHFNGSTGADWLALKDFDMVIKLVGGVPRALEILVEMMKGYSTLPAAIDLKHWRDEFYTRSKEWFKQTVFSSASPKTWPLLLSAAGYNAPYERVAGTSDEPLSVADLERMGFLSCIENRYGKWRQCYYDAISCGPKMLVLDAPLPLFTMMAKEPNLQFHRPDPSHTFSDAEAQELKHQLAAIVSDVYANPSLREQAILNHFLLRWNVFNFADSDKHILAADLFAGGLFNPEFGNRAFGKEQTVIGLNSSPVKGVWTTADNKSVPNSVELMDDSVLEFSDKSPLSRGVFFDNNNLFDGHVRLKLVAPKKRPAIVWLDYKHVTSNTELTPDDVNKIIEKRKFLEQKLPQYIHLAVIYSNRDYAGGVPDDPNTCIIAKEGMEVSMSPMMKWLLTGDVYSLSAHY